MNKQRYLELMALAVNAYTEEQQCIMWVRPGITDREYYTNSFHIPVWYPISAYDKIRLEAPYHALCNAGHISYVELDGDTARNVEAFESVVRCMHDFGIGYGSINHPVDRDPICGYVGVIGDVCPRCGRREGEELSEEKVAELRAVIGGKQIVNHELLAENVFQTTYEGGVTVITNYTALPFESASGVVEAGTYLLVQEGGAL